jgi:hypothetical protein
MSVFCVKSTPEWLPWVDFTPSPLNLQVRSLLWSRPPVTIDATPPRLQSMPHHPRSYRRHPRLQPLSPPPLMSSKPLPLIANAESRPYLRAWCLRFQSAVPIPDPRLAAPPMFLGVTSLPCRTGHPQHRWLQRRCDLSSSSDHASNLDGSICLPPCNQRDVIMFRPPIDHPPSTFCHHQRSCNVALP